MADAIAAYSEAFSAYRRSIADFIVYSIVASVAGGMLAVLLLSALMAFGVLSAGSMVDFFASGNGLSIGAAGITLSAIVAAFGLLAFVWLQGGLSAAYLETLSGFISGRKQTMGGFFASILRRATSMLILAIIAGVMVGLPLLAGLAVMLFAGGLAGTAALILGAFAAMVVGILLMFSVPAIAVDGRSPADAVRTSLVAVVRNIAGVVIYLVISGLLAIPAILLAPIYVPLFYLPLTQAALVALYKRAR